MPFVDMTGAPLEFTADNWERLCAVSSYLRAADAWGAVGGNAVAMASCALDVPLSFLCRVIAARRAFEEAVSVGYRFSECDNGAQGHEGVAETKRRIAIGALSNVLEDGAAVAFADSLDMVDPLFEMRGLLWSDAPMGPLAPLAPLAPLPLRRCPTGLFIKS
jgi:hypothetical protein